MVGGWGLSGVKWHVLTVEDCDRDNLMEPSPDRGQFESAVPYSSPSALALQPSALQPDLHSSSTPPPSPGTVPWLYENRRSAQQIVPGLWLGPFACSSSGELCSHSGTKTHVIIRAAQECNHLKLLPEHPPSTVFFEFQSHHGLELLMPIFLPACGVIRAALSAGDTVGLFCVSGLSRAPAVAAAYLIAHCGMSAVEAAQCVTVRRSCVHFSDSILRQLHEFELLQKSRLSIASSEGGAAAATASRKRNDSMADVQHPQARSGGDF